MKNSIAIGAVILATGLCVNVFGQGSDEAGDPLPAGKATLVRGTISVMAADGKEREMVQDGPVYVGDKVACGKDSKVKVTLRDGTELWIGENSQMAIDEYLFAAGDKENAAIGLRFVKGTCRMVTGAITKINPERVKVRTRVATVGVRGCDVGFTGGGGVSEIYVLSLGKGERVFVETTTKGLPIMDVETGKAIAFDEATKTVIDISRAGRVILISENQGITEKKLSKDEMNQFLSKASHLPPARIDMIQDSDGSVIILKPDETKKEPSGGNQ